MVATALERHDSTFSDVDLEDHVTPTVPGQAGQQRFYSFNTAEPCRCPSIVYADAGSVVDLRKVSSITNLEESVMIAGEPEPQFTLFSWAAFARLIALLLIYGCLLGVGWGLYQFSGLVIVGSVYMSCLLGLFAIAVLERTFRPCVLRGQMLITFIETGLWMLPICVVSIMLQSVVDDYVSEPVSSAPGLLGSLIKNFLIVGPLEELVKYMGMRRILYKDYVVDPRAFVVYAATAGAAFYIYENLGCYDVPSAVQDGSDSFATTAILRSGSAFHMCTAMMMGVWMANRRFESQAPLPWYRVIALPAFIHGLEDFVLGMSFWSSFACMALEAVMLAYIIAEVVKMYKHRPTQADVHVAVRRGYVSEPHMDIFY